MPVPMITPLATVRWQREYIDSDGYEAVLRIGDARPTRLAVRIREHANGIATVSGETGYADLPLPTFARFPSLASAQAACEQAILREQVEYECASIFADRAHNESVTVDGMRSRRLYEAAFGPLADIEAEADAVALAHSLKQAVAAESSAEMREAGDAVLAHLRDEVA